MRKLLLTLLFIAGYAAFAQTNITTPYVSGTWSLAGSPYIVQNIITIAGSEVLTIEPGVVVKFIPQTKMKIDGQLVASGTSAAPIIFEATDTAGWSNQSVHTGGWNGIHFFTYAGATPDNSVMDYCTVRDVKCGPVYNPFINPFTCYRGLKISNGIFEHNHSGSGAVMVEPTINVITYAATDTFEMNKCIVRNNTSRLGIIKFNNQYGGFTKIVHSDIHDNYIGATISGQYYNMLIEDNDIHHNDINYSNGTIMMGSSPAEGIIRRNKVHHNECDELAAIGCRAGKITIENNLVCNNNQTNAWCGATGGGGGIHLAYNDGDPDSTNTYYIVRNNIIANNYSAYGGGGIYVYRGRATIANNHIINNYTPGNGKGVYILYPTSEVKFMNNLFYSESPSGVVDTTMIVYIQEAFKIWFDYNYIPSRFYKSVFSSAAFVLAGDTIHNVIGTTPGMIAPTADNNYLTNALTANFNLQSTSPCINEGDSTGAYPATVDYMGSNRIENIIDIGAYEYRGQGTLGIEELNGNDIFIYPNPADLYNGFYITLPENEGTLVMYDLSGKIVYNHPVTAVPSWIQTDGLSAGMYMVYFYGKTSYRGKLMIR